MPHFDDKPQRLKDEADRLAAGMTLNPFDAEVVEIVAGLTLRAKDARESIEREGLIIEDGKGFPVEHPGLLIEKRASAELRGWVKDRPDLFGAKTQSDKKPGRRKFTVAN